MFFIGFVDEQLVSASAGNLATQRLKYYVTNRRVITALLEIYKFFTFSTFSFLINVGITVSLVP